MWYVFYKASRKHRKNTHLRVVRDPFRPVRPRHTFLVTSLLGTNIGCCIIILNKISGHRYEKSFIAKPQIFPILRLRMKRWRLFSIKSLWHSKNLRLVEELWTVWILFTGSRKITERNLECDAARFRERQRISNAKQGCCSVCDECEAVLGEWPCVYQKATLCTWSGRCWILFLHSLNKTRLQVKIENVDDIKQNLTDKINAILENFNYFCV